MIWPDLHIAGLGTWLPEPVPVREAVETGRYDAERCKARDYVSICVGEDVAPPDMAVAAGRAAIAQSGLADADFSAVLHASLWFQGLDIWPTASYVAAGTVGRAVPAYDLQQRCNAGLAAIEFAGAMLTAGVRPGSAALITTADRFSPPRVDRWNMHDLNVYADGGTAMVLSDRRGLARVLATATVADNALEATARGNAPFLPVPPADEPIDLVARSHEYGLEHDAKQAELRIARLVGEARNQVLAQTRTPLRDVRRIVVGATGRFDGGWHHHNLLGVPEPVTTWEYGRTTGHVGAGDWAAGLAWLLRTRAVSPGDRVMLCGGGAGYSITTVLLEITELPAPPEPS